TVPIVWTVTNRGTRDTREEVWADNVFLSTDPSVDTGDVLLGSSIRRGTLARDASYTTKLDVRLPIDVQGSFYILVFTDAPLLSRPQSDLVKEFRDEGNNITAAALTVLATPAPDLQVTAVVAPDRVVAGQFFDLSYTLTNRGGATISGQPR